MNTADIDTTNLCSHLRNKLMDADGVYYQIWQTIIDDAELTAVVRSRQLHAYSFPHTTKRQSHSNEITFFFMTHIM